MTPATMDRIDDIVMTHGVSVAAIVLLIAIVSLVVR